MKTTASTGRWLALFVAAFILLSNGAQAQTTYNWAKLSGTGTGIVNDGVPQKLNWSWSPGGASISGTVNITRSGAGQHYVYSESQYATITGSGFYAPEYDGSTVAVNYGGVNGIYQFGSEGQYHRAPTDVSDSNPSTVTVDFSFATGQSSPQNTIISLFDPGSGANSGSFSYSVTAYLKGSRIDTSTWTLQVVDPYSPSSVNTGAYSWSAATATMTQTQFPIGSGGNFPDTLAFINTQNSVFDRLVLTASTVAVDNVAIGFGAATAPTLPVTLGKSWVNGATSDKVSLTLSGAGIQNATAGSSTAPSTTTQATAAGLAGKAVTITEAFSTGSAAGYSTAWKCTKDSDSTSVATGSGVTGNFTMPTNSGVTCAFTNTRYPSIRLSKALGGARFAANDNFSVAIRTGGASGTVVSATTAATTTGSGATVDAGTGTTGDYVAASGTIYTLTEAGTTGTSLANYTASLSCTDASGLTAAADLPANEAFDPAVGRDIKPADGAQLQCVVTNTPKAPISLQKALGGSGRIAASDQFALSATGNGAPAAVSTSGSGTAVTSGAYAFNGVAGSTYTLDEAMSTGSTSTLSQYDQKLSCTNSGPTDVSGYTTLPSTLTPAVGDNISCVVTNTPKSTDGGSGGNPPSLICNGDPVIAGSDFTNAAWSKTGDWSSISAGAVVMVSDNGVARLSQAINGVTPGALVTFTWRFRNGIVSSGAAGNSVTVNLRYNGVEYWRGSTSQGAGSAPASAAQGGATCVSGCTALAADTDRVVQIRLPTSVPITGTLQLGASSGGGTSDDPQFKGPVSVINTGLCLVKKSIGGTGAFSFATTGVDTTMGGGGTTASITTTAVNTSVYYDASSTRNDNQPLLIKSPGASANVTITETPAPGFLLSGVSCTGVTPVLDAATSKITIANVPRDTVATCTVTNSTSIVNLSKALNGSRFSTADQFSVAVRTGGVGGTVVSSSATATTTGSGATVTAGTGTTGDYYATPGQTFTLTEAGTTGTSLANYNARLTCTDAAGVMAAASLPSNEVFDPAAGRAITPLAGANLRCTITNTAIPGANITLQKALGGTGRVVASDQFALSIKGSGTPVSINTTGTGTAITSAANTVTATPGTAYTLDEAMATGSGSSLSAYTRSVTCSNTGPTSVSALTTLPVSVTPAVGDAISCLITNTPAAATVSGRVFLDNGTGSGVANDGILNGSEAPQAGIAVRLTDCAATPTVYASALTDGTGGYSFGVPASVAVNAALCVEQTNRSAARISTGASVGATALPSGTATAATGGSYTYTRGGTPDRIAFAWNGTGHANLNFGDVDNSGFAASSAKTAQPGSTVTYAHTFSAGTAGQVRFGIASETATPALAGWSTQVFADPGCTGSLQPGAAQLYPPAGTGTAVAAGGKVCIVVKQFVPASAPQGANDKVTIRADFDYGNANPALSGSYVLDDITTVSDSVLELRKEVRNVTQGVTSFGVNNQAKSGDTLEYRITYTNNGAAPIGNMVVNDATPGYTSFVSATTGTTPATLTGCTKRTPANVAPNPAVACAAAQSAGGTGPIGWTFAGSVAPGGTGTVLFQVKID